MVKCLVPKVVEALASLTVDLINSGCDLFCTSAFDGLTFDLIGMTLKESLKQAIIVNKQPLSTLLQSKKQKSLFGSDNMNFGQFSISSSSDQSEGSDKSSIFGQEITTDIS